MNTRGSYWACDYEDQIWCVGPGKICYVVTSPRHFVSPGPKSKHYDTELTRIVNEFNKLTGQAIEVAKQKGNVLRFIRTPEGIALTWGLHAESDPAVLEAIKSGKAISLEDTTSERIRKLLDY